MDKEQPLEEAGAVRESFRRDPDTLFEVREAIGMAIANKFLCQSKEMPWEDRSDQLAAVAVEAMLERLDFLAARKALSHSSETQDD